MHDRYHRLLDWYSYLSPTNLDEISHFYTADARFKDPFNEVQGISAIRHVFEHMFSNTEEPRFEILQQLADPTQAFVTWIFHFGLRGRRFSITGATHFNFAADGRVLGHRDYWDSAEELIQKLPLVGAPARWLRRRLSATRSA